MREVRVPRLNANDVTCTLVEWLVTDGQWVSTGDPVAVVESAKAAEELACQHDGYVQILVPAGADCRFGQVIARLHATGAPPRDATPLAETTGDARTGPVVTAAARALIERHGLDPAQVHALGRRVVRPADLEPLLPAGPRRALSPAQRAVAVTVTESHRGVPAAFVAVTAVVDGALAVMRDLRRRHRCLIGLPELLVKAVAVQHADHPLCFARPLDPATVELSAAAHVGVTVDVGQGLRVPVVRHAARLSWPELSAAMMTFRQDAIRGTLRSADSAAGNITVALHTDEDVAFAVPLVHPGQVCAVSLAATRPELFRGAGGTVTQRRVVHLGLAYDHRVINGRDAVAFLRAVSRTLDSGAALAAHGEPAEPDPVRGNGKPSRDC
jgi:2-oxoglutarate dehydrogenase E2 component (dihydrolipoamide succinyltransferase)